MVSAYMHEKVHTYTRIQLTICSQGAQNECNFVNPCVMFPLSCVDSDISTNGTRLSCTCPQGYVGDGSAEGQGCAEVT